MVEAMDVDNSQTEVDKKEKKSAEEEKAAAPPVPDLSIAQQIFKLSVASKGGEIGEDVESLKSTLSEKLVQTKACDLYKALGAKYQTSFKIDSAKLTAMTTENGETLTKLLAEIATAKESAGEMEVLDGMFALARFYSSTGKKAEAFKAFDEILDLPKISSGKKLDAIMEKARCASFHEDSTEFEKIVNEAIKLSGAGGDWDRKNRLKIYDSIIKISNRDLKGASELLKDCIQTYSCAELCPYEDFVLYTVVTNVLHMKRTELKKKIVDGPEVLAVINEKPALKSLVSSLYECDYVSYMNAIVDVAPIIASDRFLAPHCGYILRELHVMGYKQFLDSYKSVQLSSMASTFGVSIEYLDLQLSRFISAGRLNAKIDKAGGIVETNRPDIKNAQYIEIVKKGDSLLNKIQKLARVADV